MPNDSADLIDREATTAWGRGCRAHIIRREGNADEQIRCDIFGCAELMDCPSAREAMDLKQLKYFISIADFGSMTRASESLNIAQPALTQQVAKLEADLRTRVFDRGTSGVKLTPAGAVLYRYAKSIIKQVDDARLAVSDEDKYPTGRVTIVSSYCISIMRQ